jgi:hypothetical protein
MKALRQRSHVHEKHVFRWTGLLVQSVFTGRKGQSMMMELLWICPTTTVRYENSRKLLLIQDLRILS